MSSIDRPHVASTQSIAYGSVISVAMVWFASDRRFNSLDRL